MAIKPPNKPIIPLAELPSGGGDGQPGPYQSYLPQKCPDMAEAWSLLFILSLLGIFFVLSSAFSTLGHLLSPVRTTDFMYTSVSLLNYGLLSVGKYVIKD